MPITVNILENKVLGREFKRGFREGHLRIIRPLIEKRFGPIPPWVEERLSNLSMDEIDALVYRLLDAPTLQDLLP